MLNNVKDFVEDIGCRASEFARSVGKDSGKLARRVGKDSSKLARRVSKTTVKTARDIGPTRALIGLAIAGAAIGGSVFVVRYLRSKRAEADAELTAEERDSKRMDRKRKPMHAHTH
jgi:hypothetical protein